MLKKMKTVTMKFSVIFFAFMLIAIAPTMTAEAKSKDISKVVNKSAKQVAKYFKLNDCGTSTNGSTMYAIERKGSKFEEPAIILQTDIYGNQRNWMITAYTNSMSIYGINTNMTRSKIKSILTKKGWKCLEETPDYIIYKDKKGHIINVAPKNEKPKSKMYAIAFFLREWE